MSLLINIDNGGTLTDFCVMVDERVFRTKSVTTPYDLSKCLFDGLRKVSRLVLGEEDLLQLLLAAEHIRYSTTQGTNALVERKGPRIGLLLSGLEGDQLISYAQARDMFASLIDRRVAVLDSSLDGEALEREAASCVNRLAAEGANRIVVGAGGAERVAIEKRLRSILLRKFPPHLLGALPILYSHELVHDDDDVRRIWTAIFNAFLHPPMERFLYSAEHRLRDYKARNPLLIFRNDGASSRVARTAAIQTYSSGPRGGAEGLRALSAHYGFDDLVGMDVGGTTTDISVVSNGELRIDRRGSIEGVTTSLPLGNVVSVGVGGSSIIRVLEGGLKVGPESVGGAPGPACFGFGGKEATITDAFLTMGLLDPVTYFAGELALDAQRAHAAIEEKIARPLDLDVVQAAEAMEAAWVRKVANALRETAQITPRTTLAAIGGAGPFVVCRIAADLGISRVVIPKLAPVFSAFGLGFSDIAHEYEAPLESVDDAAFIRARTDLLERARRGMFAEGFALDDCTIEMRLLVGDDVIAVSGDSLPSGLSSDARPILTLRAVKEITRARLSGQFGGERAQAIAQGERRIRVAGRWAEVPLHRVSETEAALGHGPAVLEDEFFTCRIEPGWTFEHNDYGDILLTRATQA